MTLSFRVSGLAVMLLAACAQRGQPPPTARAESSLPGVRATGLGFSIETYGSLQAVIDYGKTGSIVGLSRFEGDKKVIGLGLLSALRGEVTIVEGKTWVSYPNNDGTMRSTELGANDETAALLVAAVVPEWQSLALPQQSSFDDLEDAIENLGRSAGLDVEKPFPFLIEGALVNLAFNVIDGRAFVSESALSREALMAASVKGQYPSTQGTIVGFFSKQEHPEFLEPGASMHLHVVLRSERQMGHVTHVDLPSGTSFRLPVPQR